MVPRLARVSLISALLTMHVAAFAQQPALSPEDAALREQIRTMYQQMGRSASDEELNAALAAFKQKQAAMIGSIMALQAQAKSGGMPVAAMAPAPMAMAAPTLAAQPAAMPESEIRAQMDAWPPFAGAQGVKRMRDGIEINGQQLIDPEGRINQYAFDEATGNLGYVVELPSGQLAVKLSRPGVSAPLRIATIVRNGATWAAQLASGAAFNGNYFSVQPSGFVLSRDSAVFSYQAGKGVASFGVPNGYNVAPMQRGNIAATGYILLEKAEANGGMVSSLFAIGKGLGLSRKEDYALLRLSDARLVALNVDADSKLQSVGVNCRKRNSIVNECSKFNSFESLWSNVGTRSWHYYWRIDWLQSKAGPVAVVNEGPVLKVITLDDGKEVPVLKRALGINEFDLTRAADGVLGIRAKMGFSYETVPDIVAAIDHPPLADAAH